MKIGPLEPKAPAATTGTERKAGNRPAAEAAEPSAHVALSSTAALHAADAGDGTFDAEKVERLAQAIRDGKFQVNPEVIADKLIANAQELLGKVSR
jgi:negative regulator of flagellin synthesis FlgM